MVLQMDLVNAYDRNPDKTFSKGFIRDSSGEINPASTFNPNNDVWNFLMCNAHWTGKPNLMRQDPLVPTYKETSDLLDGRWKPLTYSRRQRFL